MAGSATRGAAASSSSGASGSSNGRAPAGARDAAQYRQGRHRGHAHRGKTAPMITDGPFAGDRRVAFRGTMAAPMKRVFVARSSLLARAFLTALVVGLGLLAPAAVQAHGADALVPPALTDILFDWAFDPLVAIPLLLAAAAYLWAVRHVNAAHPAHPVPWSGRSASWVASRRSRSPSSRSSSGTTRRSSRSTCSSTCS